MAYGTIKVDTVTFTDGGIDKSVTLSGLVQNPTFSGNVNITGTLSGVTVTGTTASFTSGVFTNISGGTHTITSGVFAAGSAASPSISFVSDPDTGVYSPGANQVAISTAGTGRLFVDASGNVGVGGSPTPFGALTVFSSGVGTHISSSSGAAGINFYENGVGRFSLRTLNGSAGLSFYDSFNNTERLRITADGKVGVGTSAPGATLHSRADSAGSGSTPLLIQNRSVSANTAVGISFAPNTSDTADRSAIIYGVNSSGGIGNATDLTFHTNANGSAPSEKVRVTSDGKVGVGTSNPAGLGGVLAVQKNQTADTAIVVDNSGTSGASTTSSFIVSDGGATRGWFRRYRDGSGNTGIGFTDALLFEGNIAGTKATRMAIDSSGNVGIGTTSPATAFEVSTTSPVIRSTHSLTGDYLQFFHNGSGAYVDYSADDLIIRSASGTERLRITSDGKVGIATSSPGARLDVAGQGNIVRLGDGTNTHDVRFQGPNNWAVQLDTSTDVFNIQRNSVPLLNVNGAGLVGIGTTGPQSILHLAGSSPQLILDPGSGSTDPCSINSWRTNAPIVFKPGDAERVRIDGSGRLLVGTSTNIATAGLGSNLQVAGTDANSSSMILRRDSNDGEAPAIGFGKSRGSLGSATIVSANDALGYIYFAGADGTDANSYAAWIKAEVDGTPGANDMPGRLVFSTTADGASSPTERMRIRNDGVISTFNSVGDSLNIYNGGIAGTSSGLIYGLHSATNNVSGGTICFVVYTNGNVVNTNNSYGAYSDAKLKENIVDASSQWDDIKDLRVRNYNFIEGQTHTQIGVVAQEVELVSPGLVSESPDRDEDGNDLGTVTKSVNYSVLYMKAVKALQEAMERIETLEAKVAALESA